MTIPAKRWAGLSLAFAGVLAGVTGAAPAAAEQGVPSAQFQNKQLNDNFAVQPGAPGTASAPPARQVTGPDKWPDAVRAIFVGVSGGVGYASFKHPEVATTKLVGPILAFQVGYRITPAWAVSLVYTDFQREVARNSGGELFATSTSLLRAQADCTKCIKYVPGGAIVSTTFRLSTLGPAVDVTPFGRNGPFVGVQGGVAITSATEAIYGAAGTARAGLRLRPVDNLSLGVEGGVQGQAYHGGSATLGYGAAEVRLSF